VLIVRFTRRRREREKAAGERKGKIYHALPSQPSAVFFAVVI
jgi:hypothetical protein